MQPPRVHRHVTSACWREPPLAEPSAGPTPRAGWSREPAGSPTETAAIRLLRTFRAGRSRGPLVVALRQSGQRCSPRVAGVLELRSTWPRRTARQKSRARRKRTGGASAPGTKHLVRRTECYVRPIRLRLRRAVTTLSRRRYSRKLPVNLGGADVRATFPLECSRPRTLRTAPTRGPRPLHRPRCPHHRPIHPPPIGPSSRCPLRLGAAVGAHL